MSESIVEILQRARLRNEQRNTEIMGIALQMAVEKLHALGWHDGGVQYFKQMADMHYYSALQSKREIERSISDGK